MEKYNNTVAAKEKNSLSKCLKGSKRVKRGLIGYKGVKRRIKGVYKGLKGSKEVKRGQNRSKGI